MSDTTAMMIEAEAEVSYESKLHCVVRLRQDIKKAKMFFDHVEIKEDLHGVGITWVHRMIPKYDQLNRVSSDCLRTVVDMALWQIELNKKEKRHVE